MKQFDIICRICDLVESVKIDIPRCLRELCACHIIAMNGMETVLRIKPIKELYAAFGFARAKKPLIS